MRIAPPCPECGYFGHVTPGAEAPSPVGTSSVCPQCGTPLNSPARPTTTGEDPTPLPFESPPPEDKASQIRTKQSATTALGDFRLLRKLGEGAMGAVYKAKEVTQGGRSVALKVLFRHVARKPKCVERFYREARVMMQLDHPNFVRGYTVGEEQGLHYFAMEYVSGCSVQHWIDRHGPLGVGEALNVTLAIAQALGYAHGRDLIHRDIKPDNVLLAFPRRGRKDDEPVTTPGVVVPVQVKITDLGMAKVLDDDLDLTQTGYGVGTPCYMPLEQAKNSKDVDGRSDIYALGCLLYCLLTGQPPFSGATIIDLVTAKEANNFRPARRFNTDVPQRLDLIIYKMVAKLPRDRHQTCAEVIRDLESLQLAHQILCLPRPEIAPVRPGAGSSSDSGERVSRTPESVPSSDVKTRVVNLDDDTAGSGVKAEPPRPSSAPGVWHVRYRSKGRTVKRVMTTAEVLLLIDSEAFDPATQASRSPEAGFRTLAGYREFKAAVVPRLTKAGADGQTSKLRTLARQAVGEKEPGKPAKDSHPAGNLGITWPKALLIGGGLLLLAGLVVLVVKLLTMM